jgi:hypothetical protein
MGDGEPLPAVRRFVDLVHEGGAEIGAEHEAPVLVVFSRRDRIEA